MLEASRTSRSRLVPSMAVRLSLPSRESATYPQSSPHLTEASQRSPSDRFRRRSKQMMPMVTTSSVKLYNLQGLLRSAYYFKPPRDTHLVERIKKNRFGWAKIRKKNHGNKELTSTCANSTRYERFQRQPSSMDPPLTGGVVGTSLTRHPSP